MFTAAEGESAPIDEKELKDQVEMIAASLDAEVQDISYDKGQESGIDNAEDGTTAATAYKATATTDIGEISD